MDAGDRRAPASSCREILQPLKPFHDQINVDQRPEHALAYGSGATANHNRSAAAFLSGALRQDRRRSRSWASRVDQVVAQKIGQDTPLPSLELMIEEAEPSTAATA